MTVEKEYVDNVKRHMNIIYDELEELIVILEIIETIINKEVKDE